MTCVFHLLFSVGLFDSNLLKISIWSSWKGCVLNSPYPSVTEQREIKRSISTHCWKHEKHKHEEVKNWQKIHSEEPTGCTIYIISFRALKDTFFKKLIGYFGIRSWCWGFDHRSRGWTPPWTQQPNLATLGQYLHHARRYDLPRDAKCAQNFP